MKLQETERRIRISELEKESVFAENTQNCEVVESNATLGEAEASSKRRIDIADIEAHVAAQKRQVELEKELYIKTQEQEMEKKRAAELTGAKVKAESLIAESEGKARAIIIEADAQLYSKQKEADGIQAVYEAQAFGLGQILTSSEGNTELAKFYLALDKNLLPELAKHGASAVRDMNPDITIWNTGSDPANPMDSIIKTVQSLSPLMQGIKDQSGVTMPDWMPQIDSSLKKNKND